jgi:hypothetical protein
MHATTPQTDNIAADAELRLMTLAEAAELLRTPAATLRYWRYLGTGPHSFRVGRRVMYRYADLCAWIEHQEDHSRAGRVTPTQRPSS